MTHKYNGRLKDTNIRPIGEGDLEQLRVWRNDKTISRYLSKIEYIDEKMQREWYRRIKEDNGNVTFVIADDKRNLLGTTALYCFETEKRKSKVKILIGNHAGEGHGYRALVLTLWVGFIYLNLENICLDVCTENTIAYKLYRKTGFTVTGSHSFRDNMIEYEMVISKDDYESINSDALAEINVI